MSEPTTALAPIATEVMVSDAMPLLSGAQMEQAFAKYGELQAALDRAMGDDAIVLIGDRQFRKKPYWRAVALAFNLTVELVSEEREIDGVFADGRENFVYLVTYRASTPGGRTQTGDGACAAVEKAEKFKCPHPEREGSPRSLHYPHERCPDYDESYRWRALPAQASVHNVRSHAHTRAFNRAVSNLVAFGEVSAEEVDRDEQEERPGAERPAGSPSTARRPSGGDTRLISEAQNGRLWTIARRAGWSDTEVHTHLKRYGFEHSTEITRDKYDAIWRELEVGVDGTRGAR
jgi:hypothetical protein